MSVMCIAKHCHFQREEGSLFCHRHKSVDARITFIAKHARPEPRKPIKVATRSNPKFVVKWLSFHACYECTLPGMPTTGHGESPGEAMRNWLWWYEAPF